MTQLLVDMLPAAMLGLFVAIPFGPICLMCVQRTLASGIWFGIASGFGAAVAHGLFSFLAQTSAVVLAQTAVTVQAPLRIAGGLALIVIGLRTYLVPTRTTRVARSRDLCSAFLSMLLIAAANPMTSLPYLAIVAVPQAERQPIMSCGLAVPIGVMLGSASWYLALALAANTMFQNLEHAMLDRLNTLAAILLIGLGAAFCVRVA
ncbi:LysE family transporter [Bradyrhizobium sp. LHD-71]|uniref:LysE family translocator n=1 Tax=Bradyrhizobium sp. LHD-71 TaxID=3072141 RepID=UPI0028105368|nr:LysE family transporter [Bradyrhizobium sp. LHD-71]MDQ8728872.1 LysE family transporter [Bradyrhizobium sp. LHD-71]